MPRRLDRFPTALREYEFVSAEPPSSSAVTAPAAGRLKATGVDVRRFPWIRPLAGDYAYNFSRVEGLYAGDPTQPDAWREAIRRAQAHPRNRASLVAVLDAQQQHPAAPPQARDAAARLADP